MWISKNRNNTDVAFFSRSYWSGFLEGTDGYPTTDGYGGYYIAGGDKDRDFRATAIEFYGVKTRT